MKYESLTYRHQHPLSFVNWLPLDPMYHNSEFIENEKVREYDNDAVSVDFRHIYITPLNKAGFFASYHAYPYYPDFIYNDAKYRNFKTKEGQSHYAGYIHDLKEHLRDIPLVIAEFGVPSSRGNSHYDPNGYDQGGHTEEEQGLIDAKLTREIYQQGGAGAILFAWIDEWFKFNWLVMDFEQPQERRKLWHNMENPEQNFGLLAMEQAKIKVDGNPGDWKTAPLAQAGSPVKAFFADADAAYLYLRLQMKPFSDWQKYDLLIGINTHDPHRGSHFLPGVKERISDGLEFLLTIRDTTNAYLLVDEPYSVFTNVYNDFIPSYRSPVHEMGKFVEQKLLANRQRIQLDGTVTPEVIHYRSKLRFGRSNPDLQDFNSLADWYYNPENGELEIRLTWHLLNVTDPSSRQVLEDRKETPDIDCKESDGFTFYILVKNKEQVIQKIPQDFSRKGIYYLWEKWEKPWYRSRLKQSYYIVKETFRNLEDVRQRTDSRPIPLAARLTPWPEGKPGAVTIAFDDAGYDIYKYGYPELKKYDLPATVGIVATHIGEQARFARYDGSYLTRRLSWAQLRELQRNGWEVACQLAEEVNSRKSGVGNPSAVLRRSKEALEQQLGQHILTFYYSSSGFARSSLNRLKQSGFLFAWNGKERYNESGSTNLFRINSFAILNDQPLAPAELIHMLERDRNKWTVLGYRHISPYDFQEKQTGNSQNVKPDFTITPEMFRRHARIIRNTGYYVGTIAEVGKYLKLRQNARVKLQILQKFAVLQVQTSADEKYFRPVSVEVTAPWKIVEIKGSAADGIYNLRNGKLLIDVWPQTGSDYREFNRSLPVNHRWKMR